MFKGKQLGRISCSFPLQSLLSCLAIISSALLILSSMFTIAALSVLNNYHHTALAFKPTPPPLSNPGPSFNTPIFQGYVASLTGKNTVPPVDTSATGTAKFVVNPNGTLSYEVALMNISQVIGAPVSLKNGTVLVELLNLYATTGGGNKQQSAYPTGPVNGKLVSDVITAAKLDGPLFGKNVTDLINYVKSGSTYVTIRTTPHPQGEIRGQILPAS